MGRPVRNDEVHREWLVRRVIAYRVMARIEKGVRVVRAVVRGVVVDN